MGMVPTSRTTSAIEMRTGIFHRAGTALERTKCHAAQRHRAARLLAVGLFVLATPARAAPSWTETVLRAPVAEAGRQVMIDVTVLRPRAAGPFPVVVLSHGSPRSAEEGRREGRQWLLSA